MISLLHGETVIVIRKIIIKDDLGEPIEETTTRTPVDDVLVAPGATADMDAQRPNGVIVSFTLGFPKTFQESLRDCLIDVRGLQYKVVGDPHPLTPENIPGPHNYTVEVTRADG